MACVHDWALRIIPARAGPTTRAVGSLSTRTDHPRSCGANDGVVEVAHLFSGSSPLVRGQPDYIEHCGGWLRIIPARAGPTPPRPASRWSSSDHPRSCGANVIVWVGFALLHGSSPLVRGQPDKRKAETRSVRIIPARAGPTSSERHAPSTMTDHPRSCGANANAATPSTCRSGSSPLVRGQRQTHPRVHDRERIIPARAGPTSFPFLWWSGGSDHPRSCGANSFTLAFNWPITGSSPLVRGQRRFPEPFDAPHRIIPARGGANVSR